MVTRCEQHVTERHRRRRPERDDEPEIDRMPDHPIESRRLELDWLGETSGEMRNHLRVNPKSSKWLIRNVL